MIAGNARHLGDGAFACIASAIFVLKLAYSFMAPFFPGEAKERSVTAVEIGICFGIYSAASLVASCAVGAVCRRVEPARLMVLGVVLAAVATACFGALAFETGHVYVLIAMGLRAMQGLGFALVEAGASALLTSALSGKRLSSRLQLLEAAAGVGLMTGPCMGGVLYVWGGFAIPFWGGAGVMAALAVVMAIVIPNQAAEAGVARLHGLLRSDSATAGRHDRLSDGGGSSKYGAIDSMPQALGECPDIAPPSNPPVTSQSAIWRAANARDGSAGACRPGQQPSIQRVQASGALAPRSVDRDDAGSYVSEDSADGKALAGAGGGGTREGARRGSFGGPGPGRGRHAVGGRRFASLEEGESVLDLDAPVGGAGVAASARSSGGHWPAGPGSDVASLNGRGSVASVGSGGTATTDGGGGAAGAWLDVVAAGLAGLAGLIGGQATAASLGDGSVGAASVGDGAASVFSGRGAVDFDEADDDDVDVDDDAGAETGGSGDGVSPAGQVPGMRGGAFAERTSPPGRSRGDGPRPRSPPGPPPRRQRRAHGGVDLGQAVVSPQPARPPPSRRRETELARLPSTPSTADAGRARGRGGSAALPRALGAGLAWHGLYDSDATLVPTSVMLGRPWVASLVVALFAASSGVSFLWPVLGPHLLRFGLDAAVGGLFFGLASVSYAAASGLAAALLIARAPAATLLLGVAMCAGGFVFLGPALPADVLPFSASLQVLSMLLLGGGAGLVGVSALPLILRDSGVRRLGSGAVETGSRITAGAAAGGEAVGPVVAGLLVTLFGDQGKSQSEAFGTSCAFAAVGLLVVTVCMVVITTGTSRCDAFCAPCSSLEEQSTMLGVAGHGGDGARGCAAAPPRRAGQDRGRRAEGSGATVRVQSASDALVMVI